MKIYVRFPGFKFKALTFSYDDGVKYDNRLVSIFKKYGLKGTFNLCSSFFAECDSDKHLTKSEALGLYLPSGMEIAVHGQEHFSLAKVDTTLAITDVAECRKSLENDFGRIIYGMAFANGSYSDEIIDILKKIGIKWARITGQSENFDLPTDWMKWQTTCHHDNPRLMELAERFIEMKEDSYFWASKAQVFSVWGHSYEFARNDNWERIEKFAEYVSCKEDIWYATNGEIYDYISASEQIVFSMDGKMVFNPTGTDIYVDFIGSKIVIPAGKTVRLRDAAI